VQSRTFNAVLLWGPPLALMAVIFYLSAQPSTTHHGTFMFILRKIAHFTEYAVLLGLWFRALRTRLSLERALVVSWVICVGYAATDEFHQTFVHGRVGIWRDVVIDACGALVLALVIRATVRARRRPVPAGG
jgi:VanZ family protein